MRPVKTHLHKTLLALAAYLGVTIQPAHAQLALDHMLSAVEVSSTNSCQSVVVRLNRPASYQSHFPISEGMEVNVRLEPLATTLPSDGKMDQREAASIASLNAAGLTSATFDPFATGGPTIHLSFAQKTAFKVVMDRDSRLLRVDAASPENAARCLGVANTPVAAEAPKADETAKSDGKAADTAAATPPPQDADAAFKEGKSLLASGDAQRAALFFTKVVTIGQGRIKQDAQEMLGLSRERAGQLAHARAEYETYLKAYPRGDDAVRVKGRLNDVMAAMDAAAQQQFAAHKLASGGNGQAVAAPGKGNGQQLAQAPDAGGKGSLGTALPGVLVTNQGTKVNFKNEPQDPKAWTWRKYGSVGQYYYRDDNYSQSDITTGSIDRHDTFQNEVISNGDLFVEGENDAYRLGMRSSLYNEYGLGEQKDQRETNIGTLYVEGEMKQPGLGLRLGRQNKSTGGVFGRFDGGVATWQPTKDLKLQAVAGAPVYSRAAKPFADGRIFYGANIDYNFPGDKWAGSVYAIEQDIKSVVDRRAIGAELRYFDSALAFYSSADYDIFYKELNNAYASGTWNISEGNSLYATADFRRVPFLLTSNALMGQQETQLSSLVDIFGENEVEQLATDRTANSKTLTVGGSKALGKDWQWSVDATIADYSGTPASGGVDEIPDPGVEYYASTQLNGSNLFKDNDVLTLGLRYSNSESADMYMADAFYRFPVTENFRVHPRLRVSMRKFKTQDRTQYLFMPSLQARYRINKVWNFEFELGARWEDNRAPAGDTHSLDVLATAGYRYEF